MTDPILEVRDLHKTYRIGFTRRRVEAIRGLSFEVRQGEVFGLLGPNGAGKTSTIKAALRLVTPTSGEVRLFGNNAWQRDAMRRVGYLPENPYVYQYLNATEFLDLCARLTDLSASERSRRIPELIDRVGLSHALDRRIGKFSKGMMQRVGLAQALLHEPEFLILDEPMSGLDPIGRKQVREIILDEHRKGKTILFTSHILTDVEMLCDRVAIVNHGKLSAEGKLKDLLAHQKKEVEITVRTTDETLLARIESEGRDFRHQGDEASATFSQGNEARLLLQKATAGGAEILQVRELRESLESFFVQEASKTELESPSLAELGSAEPS
jgi:ABC-2 type transport system ATP-binding protein